MQNEKCEQIIALISQAHTTHKKLEQNFLLLFGPCVYCYYCYDEVSFGDFV